jgi:DeoR family ulaG and ulaABCDEF operon transcriptional repressor
MNIHQAQNHDEKVRIARAASQLVNPGESVVINCGSTAFLLGREMCGKPVQIITNYLPLANYLIDQEHESVVIMGGQYNKSQSITLSPQDSENSLYAGHWMFTSGKGLTAEGLYKTDMLTAMAEQNMLNVVGKLVVLVDSSKVGERAGMLFSRAEQIDMVITGKMPIPRSSRSWKIRASQSCAFKGAGGKTRPWHPARWRNAVAHTGFPQAGQIPVQPFTFERLLQAEGFNGRHNVVCFAVPQQ